MINEALIPVNEIIVIDIAYEIIYECFEYVFDSTLTPFERSC